MRTILLCLCVLFSVYTVVVYDVTGGRSAEAPTPEARAGMRLWQENNCQSCHQFYGLGGYMGPDLTNVAARRDEQRLRAPRSDPTGTHAADRGQQLAVRAAGALLVVAAAVALWHDARGGSVGLLCW